MKSPSVSGERWLRVFLTASLIRTYCFFDSMVRFKTAEPAGIDESDAKTVDVFLKYGKLYEAMAEA